MAAAATVKYLSDTGACISLPSSYTFPVDPREQGDTCQEDSIPVIDFSLLTSGTPDQRSRIVQLLGKACQEWGFFMVVNHGVGEQMIKGMIEACESFFNMKEEEKHAYQGKHVLDPIRCGTSFNLAVDKSLFWRDFLKVIVHPHFHSPDKPSQFRDISEEYCRKTREMARELLKGISESLGLESCYIDKTLSLDSGLQILVGNLYPPCPEPELAMGMPPHSDHGLLTILLENGIGGLQVLHNGKWITVKSVPNSFLVNTADHLEILSNGKYKSNIHRAMVNKKATRISIAVANGPSLDTIVSPAPELVKPDCPPSYIGMKYQEYVQLQQSNQLLQKTCLERVRLLDI